MLNAGLVIGGGVTYFPHFKLLDKPSLFENSGSSSFGFQVGRQATDFVLFVRKREGALSLLLSKFKVGSEASVAAVPVRRPAGASTDLKFVAQILSHSCSKSSFPGLELKCVVINTDADDMRDVYGNGVDAKDVVNGNIKAPSSVMAFPKMLEQHIHNKAEA